MDPIELARRAAMTFFQARQVLAAGIVYGEALKLAPADPGILLGFGSAVDDSAGQLVIKPFVQWSTRILNRCIAVQSEGPFAKIAHERLARLATRPEYVALPPIEPEDVEPLLAYLDLDPRKVLPGAIDKIAADDRMFAIMALGELRAPRFWGAMASAVAGRWGGEAARAGLKRVGPYAANSVVREAMVTLRSSPLADACDPYLAYAERSVASVPITVTPAAAVPVDPPAATRVQRPVAADHKPWWKIW